MSKITGRPLITLPHLQYKNVTQLFILTGQMATKACMCAIQRKDKQTRTYKTFQGMPIVVTPPHQIAEWKIMGCMLHAIRYKNPEKDLVVGGFLHHESTELNIIGQDLIMLYGGIRFILGREIIPQTKDFTLYLSGLNRTIEEERQNQLEIASQSITTCFKTVFETQELPAIYINQGNFPGTQRVAIFDIGKGILTEHIMPKTWAPTQPFTEFIQEVPPSILPTTEISYRTFVFDFENGKTEEIK